ncbi:MAG: hypothetical protein P8N43_03795, partial [Alphaproteobacteria bacterium]|nr:hypothetical protein [Alphaproteobacteria bacterium]
KKRQEKKEEKSKTTTSSSDSQGWCANQFNSFETTERSCKINKGIWFASDKASAEAEHLRLKNPSSTVATTTEEKNTKKQEEKEKELENKHSTLVDEILINKAGESVLLKSDHTWEVIDTSGLDNKVLFTIIEGKNVYTYRDKKDDFGEVIERKFVTGCWFTMSVKNNTEHKVSVKGVEIRTTRSDSDGPYAGFSPQGEGSATFNEVLNPGDSAESSRLDFYMQALFKIADIKLGPAEKLSSEIIESIQDQYGCDSLVGTLFLRKGYYNDLVVFPSSTGISKKEIVNYVAGNPNGAYPLREKVSF